MPPPLRERKEDISALVQHFIEKYNIQFGLAVTDVDIHVREFLYAYDWLKRPRIGTYH